MSLHKQNDENVVQITEQVHGNLDITTVDLGMVWKSHLVHVKTLRHKISMCIGLHVDDLTDEQKQNYVCAWISC
jgi:hypothetical protein